MSILSAVAAKLLKLPAPLTRKIIHTKDIQVAMSDGVILLTDLYQPDVDMALPTMLVRSPYGKGPMFSFLNATLVAERGFNVVFQCVRGTHGSGGEFNFLVNEESDGADTVEWIKKQPWFNGELSTSGMSYLGYNQWAIAANYGSFLKTMNVSVSTSSFYKQLYMGDALSFEAHYGWANMMKDAGESKADMKTSSEALMKKNNLGLHLPLQTADEVGIGRKVGIWKDMINHSEPPYSHWEQTDHSKALTEISADVNFTTGWYDIFLPWSFDDYEALKKAGHKPVLTVGPWSHISMPLMFESLRQTLACTKTVDEVNKPSPRQLPVRINVMGSNQWKEFAQWPPENSQPEAWLLQPEFGLSKTPSADSPADRYTYDPAKPTPNLGGALMGSQWGAKDNRKLEARKDVLCYSSEPLSENYEIIGYVNAVLWIKSSLQHTDFFIRLCDVLPNGKSMNICDGIQRIRPESHQADNNGVIRVDIKLWPTAYCFKKGHKIRVQISSGAHPRIARNTGSGEPAATAVKLVSAQQEIYHDSQYQSLIVLPAMK